MTETEHKELKDIVIRSLMSYPGPFRTYVNPMRDDGVFIGEDKEIKPYPNSTSYPAVPNDAAVYEIQIEKKLAEEIVTELNKIIGR